MPELSKSEEKGKASSLCWSWDPSMNFTLAYLLGLCTESEVGQPNVTSCTNEPRHQGHGNSRGYMGISAAHADFRDTYIAFLTHQPREKLGSIQTAQTFFLLISLFNNKKGQSIRCSSSIHCTHYYFYYHILTCKAKVALKKEKGNVHSEWMWKPNTIGNWSWIRKQLSVLGTLSTTEAPTCCNCTMK